MSSDKYHFIDHTADAAVEVFGQTLEKLYENTIKALTSMLTSLDKLEPNLKREITIEAEDCDQLLVCLLSELIFYDIIRYDEK